MQQLPNNCRLGNIAVHPKNWSDKKLSATAVTSVWYIKYRFYDDNLKQSKQIVIKGMNEFKTLIEKQKAVKSILQCEDENLKKGFNPITQHYQNTQEQNNAVVGPYTRFTVALQKAQSTLNLSGFTKRDMDNVASNFIKTAQKITMDGRCIADINISDIKKRHIRALMNKLDEDKKWSAHSWNKFRAYLMMLFKELGEYDAVENNIPREISKRKIVKKVRVILSEQERQMVRNYLIAHNYRFWLFVNMFFHSGGRVSEFFRLKIGDIDLDRQTMKVTVKKGRQYIEVVKPIKDIAVPYWKEYLNGYTNTTLFLIGKGLCPADKNVQYYQITRRWRVIKKELNIEADFYSLKHLNTDQVSEQIGIQYAQKLNSHTNLSTTKIYAINEKAREMEMIKKVANEF